MKAVSQHGSALQFATEELRGDHEIVMQAVSEDGFALDFATQELKGDREIVMQAVSQHGLALDYAARELKGDEEVLRHALAQSPHDLVGLQVTLLSGRYCSEVVQKLDLLFDGMGLVLRSCAESLGLDPDHVERSGTLMHGLVEIKDIRELETGKLHEITLLLS